MTKVAVISDTHWGVRNDNIAFMDMTKKFLDNTFFPALQSRTIKHIIHLGDLVDRRKQISYQTANRLQKDFLDRIQLENIRATFIVGNHDCYYKNTNKINAMTELVVGKYSNIDCYIDPKDDVNIEGYRTILLPWICDENRVESLRLINESKASICLGHLEIMGFEMYRGSASTQGENRKAFDKFNSTLSGHFHHRSSDGCITYVGSHGEFTWSDYDDPRGFHIFDLRTQELEFIQNPYNMFSKIWYDDSNTTLENILKFDTEIYAGKIIKIIVKNKQNPYWFDMFCSKLEKTGPISMQIVEDHLNLNLEDDQEIINEAESTLDIFKKHISLIDTNRVNLYKLERVIEDLYNQALTVE